MVNRISNGVATPSDETKDCSVRAIANALEIPYNEAHDLLRQCGRKNRHGVFKDVSIRAILGINWVSVRIFGNSKASQDFKNKWPCSYIHHNGISLKNAIDEFMQEGSFIVYKSGHMFAVVDGELIDQMDIPDGTHINAIIEVQRKGY